MSKQTYILSQQAVNLVRQLVNAKGWATTIEDIYIGGKMLVKDLPQLDPLDWLLSEDKILKLSPEERVAYLAKDEAWGQKPFAFDLADKQVDIVKRAFKFFVEESGKAKQLGPNPFLFEIVETFGLMDEGKDNKA